MEAMIIVGLCIGSFVKGPDHELTMKSFIKHVTAIAPLLKERRNSIRADTQFFLRGQRENLFVLWNIKAKTWNGRRTEDGRFSHLFLEQWDGPAFKKQRKDKFDFSILREDVAENTEIKKCCEV